MAEQGNNASMREALVDIVLLTVKAGKSLHSDVACGIIASKAKHALSAPPRNCDVGTAEEQQNRFREFCRLHNIRGECGIGRSEAACPAFHGWRNPDCSLWWAQMPYENKEESKIAKPESNGAAHADSGVVPRKSVNPESMGKMKTAATTESKECYGDHFKCDECSLVKPGWKSSCKRQCEYSWERRNSHTARPSHDDGDDWDIAGQYQTGY